MLKLIFLLSLVPSQPKCIHVVASYMERELIYGCSKINTREGILKAEMLKYSKYGNLYLGGGVGVIVFDPAKINLPDHKLKELSDNLTSIAFRLVAYVKTIAAEQGCKLTSKQSFNVGYPYVNIYLQMSYALTQYLAYRKAGIKKDHTVLIYLYDIKEVRR
jgi:hypothetical protein